MAVESALSDVILVQADKGLFELRGPLRALVPGGGASVKEVGNLAHIPPTLAGLAATGVRTSAFVSSLSEITEPLAALAGKHVPVVVHLTGRTLQRHSGSLHGSHEDCFAAGHSGLVQLFASNVQEVADFSLIARRISELSLVPAICAQDFYSTSQSVQSLLIPEPELADSYLGQAGDLIEAPSFAQSELFGSKRRRIPRLIDIDRPAGVGGTQGSESFFRALAAQRPYFTGHLDQLIDRAFEEFAQLTGRGHSRIATYKAEDADVLVLAMGAICEDLRAVVDALRAQKRIKAGVLGIQVLRPFPAAQLAEMIKGKRCVTVLDRSDTPLSADAPLMQELRCAVDMAMENGLSPEAAAAYPGHPAYSKPADRPRLFSGVYGVGSGTPSLDALASVYLNMTGQGQDRRRFFVGADFGPADRRFPQLQRAQQKLAQHYPEMAHMSLPPISLDESARNYSVLRLKALSSEGGTVAGNVFSRALASAFGMKVRTCPGGGVESGLQASGLSILFGESGATSNPRSADTLLVAGRNLLNGLPADSLVRGGVLVVADNDNAQSLWQKLSRQTERWVRDLELKVFVLDGRKFGAAESTRHGYLDEPVIWGLLGAGLGVTRDAKSVQLCKAYLKEMLAALYGEEDEQVKEIPDAVLRGSEELEALQWADWPEVERSPVPEPESPWTAVERADAQDNVFDPVRFWHSVGFLYDIGEPGEALADPFMATGIMPAGSSAYRDMTPYRLHTPAWIPQNCTACGLCWAHCPDSALPPTLQSVQSVLETGMTLCKQDGLPLTQFTRIAGHISKLAHKLVTADGLHQFQSAGPLLAEAFAQLAPKMGLEGDALEAMQTDVDHVTARLQSWPIARTERFFDNAEAVAKGSGKLVSICVDTSHCKACGLCLAVCPEDAFQWQAPTAEHLSVAQANRHFQRALPDVAADTIAALVREDAPDTQLYRLFERGAYDVMVGGDSAFPGTGSKTAAHLVSAVIDGAMRQRYREHATHLEDLLMKLRERMQGQLADAVQINDFEDFGHRLAALDSQALGAGNLSGLLEPAEDSELLNKERLQRLAQLSSALQAQLAWYQNDRARMVLALQQDDITMWSGTYPDNPHENPWLSLTRGAAPGLALGLFDGMARRLADELSLLRAVDLELQGRSLPAPDCAVTWEGLDAKERRLLPPVVIIAQACATRWSDIQPLLESGLPIWTIVLDDDGSGIGVGKDQAQENLAELALEQRNVFVVNASIGHPGHLIQGVATGMDHPGPVLVQVYAPDPVVAGIASEEVAMDARRAYISRATPLYQFNPLASEAPLSLAENPDGAADWASLPLKVKSASGNSETLHVPTTPADWAVHQSRFRNHFKLVARGHANDNLLPLTVYLSLDPQERENREAFIHVADAQGKHVIAKLSPEVVQASERSLKAWRRLRAWASTSVPATSRAQDAPASQSASVPAAPAAATPAPSANELIENLLALCGFNSDPAFYQQTLRDYIAEQPGDARGLAVNQADPD